MIVSASILPPSLRFGGFLLSAMGLVPGGWTAEIDFVRDVRPIFEAHCYECHAGDKRRSGLRLDVKEAALLGGDNHGPDIVPGKPEESPLVRFVIGEGADEEHRMPPRGDRLSPTEIATLAEWVRQGAVWPDGVDRVKLEDKSDHWAFRPLAPVKVPETGEAGRHPIDAFLLERLGKEGLTLAPEADRVTWLRRVSFDLIGLPPTPREIASFLSDLQPGAEERVVDVLLGSPRHGERWGQHWLDVVRYADTHGFEVNTERPNAWPYRDYVIDALNRDTPYNRFVREQIAGDALGQDAATGFLVTASVLLPGQIGKDEPSKRLARQDAIDEIVVNIGQTFLGLSVGCARCHDHKFDPISQRDYFAMQAFVSGVEYGDRDLRTPEAEALRRDIAGWRKQLASLDAELGRLVPLARVGENVERRRPPVNARLNADRFEPRKTRRVRLSIFATNNLEPCVDEIEIHNMARENVALSGRGAKAVASGETFVTDRHELRYVNDGRVGNSRSWMSNEMGRGWVEIELAREEEIDRVVWGRDREGRFKDRLATDYRIEVADASGAWHLVAGAADRLPFDPRREPPPDVALEGLAPGELALAKKLQEEKRALESRIEAATNAQRAFAGVFRNPDVIHRLNRGDPEQPKELVAPAVPAALGGLSLPGDSPEQARRAALADWIARPENPLTARVLVNRVWQGHFGTGLVETPSDFGRSGLPPSHPELLDWLAGEFIRSGWSMKRLHRLIVLSAAYRQSSVWEAGAAARDAEARLLWRFPPRRLEAEPLRDAMLAVSGRLNLATGGRGFDLFDKRGGLSGFVPVESFPKEGLRRLIYAHKVRREREGVFGAFDCPDAGQSTARRRESTTPTQALNLFNSRFTLEASESLAARARHEVGGDLASQVRHCFQLALGRDPGSEELESLLPEAREHGLPVLCRALLNSNEFLFVR